MGEQDYGADLARARRAAERADAIGEQAAAWDRATVAEFSVFATWATAEAASAGWFPVPLLVTTARTTRNGPWGRESTQFEVQAHPDIRGLRVTEQMGTAIAMDGNSWLITATGQVYRYFDDGWFEESLGPVGPLTGLEEVTVTTRLRSLMLERLAQHHRETPTSSAD